MSGRLQAGTGRTLIGALALCAVLAAAGRARAEADKVRFAIQAGLPWLPFLVMEQEKIVETRAAAAGLGAVKAEITTVSGGGVMNDALLSGSLDFATSGLPPFLVIWDKSRNSSIAVKAVAAFGSLPFALVTRNPEVKSVKDFTDKDKIALPTVKASGQAVVLQMAVARAFGIENYAKLDPITITRGHPDATAALLSGNNEIDSHFSSPPYQQIEQRAPGIHTVLTTADVLEGPLSNGVIYTTQKFHDANPKLFRVVMDSVQQAVDEINVDKRAAAALYVRVTHQSLSVDEIVEAMSAPGAIYTLAPQSVFAVASFMAQVGTIKHKVGSWKELFFSAAHDLPGN
jgi:NitT/TauT family transport system substrate-binding protein